MIFNWLFRFGSGPVLLCVLVIPTAVQALWSDLDLVTIENSKTGIITNDLKVTRFNRTATSISGTVTLTADLNDDYDCEMKAYYSSKGTSKYTLLPYKVARDACCTLLESPYWKSVENRLQDSSNIPKRKGDERLCLSLKESEYEMRQFAFDQSIVPRFLDAGTYKISLMLYKKGSQDISSICTFVARIY